MKLFTVGTSGKGLRGFVRLLQEAGADCVIDVRLKSNSQLAGYAKQDDLAFVLELLGIGYEHHPELAPDKQTLSDYRTDKDWSKYLERFRALSAERDMLSVGRDVLSRWRGPCLLCSEDDPAYCHRRMLAEDWAGHIDGLEIEHLR